jgi:hypothetical protein
MRPELQKAFVSDTGADGRKRDRDETPRGASGEVDALAARREQSAARGRERACGARS